MHRVHLSVEVQGLCCSQDVALGFKMSQMYLLIRNFIWAC